MSNWIKDMAAIERERQRELADYAAQFPKLLDAVVAAVESDLAQFRLEFPNSKMSSRRAPAQVTIYNDGNELGRIHTEVDKRTIGSRWEDAALSSVVFKVNPSSYGSFELVKDDETWTVPEAVQFMLSPMLFPKLKHERWKPAKK